MDNCLNQKNSLKIGEIELALAASLNRNQIKYLSGKLIQDGILKTTGSASGTRYQVVEKYSDLRGDLLVDEVISDLKQIHKEL